MKRDHPAFDDSALNEVLGGQAPAVLERTHRVRMLGELADALVAGREPPREAALFVGGAIWAWLHSGGNLERHYLRVHKSGSHRTVTEIWRLLAEERQQGECAASLRASTTVGEAGR